MQQCGGMALINQATFLGWDRQAHIVQIKKGMAQTIPVREVIIAITRTYQHHIDVVRSVEVA